MKGTGAVPAHLRVDASLRWRMGRVGLRNAPGTQRTRHVRAVVEPQSLLVDALDPASQSHGHAAPLQGPERLDAQIRVELRQELVAAMHQDDARRFLRQRRVEPPHVVDKI